MRPRDTAQEEGNSAAVPGWGEPRPRTPQESDRQTEPCQPVGVQPPSRSKMG